MTANPAPSALPLSVWPVAQRTARGQRAGRYLDDLGKSPRQDAPRHRSASDHYLHPAR